MSRHWNSRLFEAPSGPSLSRKRRRPGGAFGTGEVRLTLLAALFISLGFAFASPGEEALAGGSSRVEDPWTVRITDGDTFRYRGDKIRIADIDTPEVRGRCDEEVKLAARATDRMEALLRAGPFEMHQLPGRDEDRYGRKLRIVVRDGRSLGDQLVAAGLARTWEGRRRPWCPGSAS